jgi:Cu-Zn family superoxide dismutase
MMKKTFLTALMGAMIVFSATTPALATAQEPQLKAQLVDSFGKGAGVATFFKTPKGVLIRVQASGLSAGWHGLHIHGTGDCSDHLDHFAKSGGHAASDGQAHGYFDPKGPHSGDLPNIWANVGGEAHAEFYTNDLNFASLTDENGAALMIHAGADDYTSQPAGDSGARVACGVVAK